MRVHFPHGMDERGISHTLGFEDPDMRIGDALFMSHDQLCLRGPTWRTCESSKYRKRPITVDRSIGQHKMVIVKNACLL